MAVHRHNYHKTTHIETRMSSKRHNTLRKVLLKPLSAVYGTVVGVRNKLFDWKILRSHQFDIPVICIGNLAVGGTGKTPHTEYVINLLRQQYNVGVLSRGYKRHTKGFVLATPHSTPRDIGDEPYQIYHKFGRQITVAVCENRVRGINRMLEINPELEIILLDDAFQHRYVQPKVSILLTEYHNPYYRDSLLPYGNLRESTAGAQRADMVIVTKCPASASALNYRLIRKYLDLFPEQDLFFSQYRYDSPRPVFPDKAATPPVLSQLPREFTFLAVCGIANPRPFVKYVKSFQPRVKVNVFPDHHDYTRKDMEMLRQRFESMPKGRRIILTTEKDAVRMINNPYFPHQLKPYIYYIPIRVEFTQDDGLSFADSLNRLIKKRPL